MADREGFISSLRTPRTNPKSKTANRKTFILDALQQTGRVPSPEEITQQEQGQPVSTQPLFEQPVAQPTATPELYDEYKARLSAYLDQQIAAGAIDENMALEAAQEAVNLIAQNVPVDQLPLFAEIQGV